MNPTEIVAALAERIAASDKRLREVEEAVSENQKALSRYLVGGAGPVHTPDRAEYERHAMAFFSQVLRRPVARGEVDYDSLRAYEAAFPVWLRRGPAISGELQAAMRVGSDPDGGFWVPPEFSMTILRRLFETSPMRQLASVDTLSSASIELPIDTDDIASGGWVGESDARNETDNPTVGLQAIYAREQFAQPEVTQKLLDDAAFNIEAWLTRKIVDKLGREENLAFVSGNGLARPRGFLDYSGAAVTTDDATRAWGVLQYVPTGSAGGFPTLSGGGDDPDALIDLQLKLKPQFLANAVWTMRRSAAGVIRKLKDKDGRYIWLDNLTEGGRPLLLGHPVQFLEDMPAVASDSFSVAFGDFRAGYGIFDHTVGVRILRDNLTKKGFVKFYTTKRVGGDVRDFDALKLLKFGVS